jgi:hypothetical protein
MKSSQGLVKSVIGCWTCPMIISVYTKEKNVRVTMKFKIPKRHILRPTLLTDMAQHVLQWERQKRCSNRKLKKQGPMIENVVTIIIFYEKKFGEENMKTRDDIRMINFLQKCLFGHILKKKYIRFLVHGHSSSLVHIWFTPSGAHGLCSFWRNCTVDSGSATLQVL